MIIPSKFDPETFFGVQLVPIAKRVLSKVGLSPAIYQAEELINDAFITAKWNQIENDGERWVGYWYRILYRTALHQIPDKSKRRQTYESDETENKTSLLEELSDDEGKSPEQIWAAIEEVVEVERWELAVEEHLSRIMEAERLKISHDPYFERFSNLVLEYWTTPRRRSMITLSRNAHSQVRRSPIDGRPPYTRAFNLAKEEAARRGEKLSKSRAQFIRDYEKLIVATRERWRSLNLPAPANLPSKVNREDVNPYYLRWILTEEYDPARTNPKLSPKKAAAHRGPRDK